MIFERDGVSFCDTKDKSGVEEILNNENILIQGFFHEESDLTNENAVFGDNSGNNNHKDERVKVKLMHPRESDLSNSKLDGKLKCNSIGISDNISHFIAYDDDKVENSKTEANVGTILGYNKSDKIEYFENVKGVKIGIQKYNLNKYILTRSSGLSAVNSLNIRRKFYVNKTIDYKQRGVYNTVYEVLRYFRRIQDLVYIDFRLTKCGMLRIADLSVYGHKGGNKVKRGIKKIKQHKARVIEDSFQLSIKSKVNTFRFKTSGKSENLEFSIGFSLPFTEKSTEKANFSQSQNRITGAIGNFSVENFMSLSDEEVEQVIFKTFNFNSDNTKDKIIELSDKDDIEKKTNLTKENELSITDKYKGSMLVLEEEITNLGNIASKSHLGKSSDSYKLDLKNKINFEEYYTHLDTDKKGDNKINKDNTHDFNDRMIDYIIIEDLDGCFEENDDTRTKSPTFESNCSDKESASRECEGKEDEERQRPIFYDIYSVHVEENNDKFGDGNDNCMLLENDCGVTKELKSESSDGGKIGDSRGIEFCGIRAGDSELIENEYNINNKNENDDISANSQYRIDDEMQFTNKGCHIDKKEDTLLHEGVNRRKNDCEQMSDTSDEELKTHSNEGNIAFNVKSDIISSIIDNYSEKRKIHEIKNLKKAECELDLALNIEKKKFGVFDKLISLAQNRNTIRAYHEEFTEDTMKAIEVIKGSRKNKQKAWICKN
ncbi:hypothetical protein FG386_002746 [Cryptosporidium ryanae]|uniref:uncharacterized protein n=1 Tax=Cryptosporidium ryanae TaxID=515981 RepID=UPI00351A50B0|nr:hypothetical protein FG386_002746 [Cryptosporidium ryanae]